MTFWQEWGVVQRALKKCNALNALLIYFIFKNNHELSEWQESKWPTGGFLTLVKNLDGCLSAWRVVARGGWWRGEGNSRLLAQTRFCASKSCKGSLKTM